LKRLLAIFVVFMAPLCALAQRSSDFDPAGEDQIIALINQERTERGLEPVVKDDSLTRAARLHTQLMVEKHELTHRLSDEPVLRDRVAVTGLAFDAAGENVAYDGSVQHAHVEFMHSPGHRANILLPKFNAVGVGVVHSGNLVWVTEDFAQKMGVTSASEAAGIVKTKFSELRKKVGSPPSEEHTMPELGRIACDMARKDHLDTQTPRKLADAKGVLAWTASDPAKLPEQVRQLAEQRNTTNYSLGVCYASSASYSNKVFWIVMLSF
jgi:uncharacterized protein YkwD